MTNQRAKATEIIETYYDSFNSQDMELFFSLLCEEVVHDINQNGSQLGKKDFRDFVTRMNYCYRETIRDLVIMVNEEGTHAAAEFIVDGIYLNTDHGLPEANNQRYSLPCGAFFTLIENKITRVRNYYNLNDWIEQVTLHER